MSERISEIRKLHEDVADIANFAAFKYDDVTVLLSALAARDAEIERLTKEKDALLVRYSAEVASLTKQRTDAFETADALAAQVERRGKALLHLRSLLDPQHPGSWEWHRVQEIDEALADPGVSSAATAPALSGRASRDTEENP